MSFTNEYAVKAVRKRYRCDICPVHIEAGEPAVRWAGMSDGEFYSSVFHPDCREAEVAYNELCGPNWDEWYRLDEMEDDSHEWLIAEYPAVAERFGLSRGAAA